MYLLFISSPLTEENFEFVHYIRFLLKTVEQVWVQSFQVTFHEVAISGADKYHFLMPEATDFSDCHCISKNSEFRL